MNRSFLPIAAIILFSLSCSAPQQSVSLNYTGYRIEKITAVDTGMANFLKPYAVSMDATMNRVIGFAAEGMSAKQPESELGNLMADCIRRMAEKKFGKKVDAGFINKGGIRSYLPKGNITVGKIYELMPFDNLVVLQEVKGSVLRSFLDKIAADGGWPVSEGVVLQLKDKRIASATINGQPLDENGLYTIANSDYVANGGDNCEMLRNIPQQNKGYILRDAIIEYVTSFTQQGKPVGAKIENRVSYVN